MSEIRVAWAPDRGSDCIALPPAATAPLVSAPTNHEVAGFMPGRLEFEHEVENDAEMPVKDMEFGLVFKYGGDQQPEAKVTLVKAADDEDEDEEDGEQENGGGEEGAVVIKKEEGAAGEEEGKPTVEANGSSTTEKKRKGKQKANADDTPAEPLVDIEDEDELEVKLALLDIYFSKLDKREDAKDLIFDRGLTEYKKVCNGSLRVEVFRPRLSENRSRRTTVNVRRTSGNWLIDTRCSPSSKQHWTTRHS